MERLTPGPLRFTAGSDKHSGTRDRSQEMEGRDWLRRRNHMPGLSSYTVREGASRLRWLLLPPTWAHLPPLCPMPSLQLSWSVNQIRLLAALQLSEASAEIQTL